MTSLVLAVAEAERTEVGFWVLTPLLLVLAVVVVVSPVWPWSRDWGWQIAGIFGVTVGTIAAFTAVWLAS